MNISKHLGDRLASHASRRGFLAMTGKVALGGAALMAGGGGALLATEGIADAYGNAACCGNPQCSTSCPPGTGDYSSGVTCCNAGCGPVVQCHACIPPGSNIVTCFYAQNLPQSCPCTHA